MGSSAHCVYLALLWMFRDRWVDGHWNGLSMQQVDHMRYQGQWLGDPLSIMSQELHKFVFIEHGVERALEPLNIPQFCGVPNGKLCRTGSGWSTEYRAPDNGSIAELMLSTCVALEEQC
jgi:hypothetical protein